MDVKEAQEAYRISWLGWLQAKDNATREVFEREMDHFQVWCTSTGKPGPEWDAFIATLPGYVEHWERLSVAAKAFVEKARGNPKG